MPHDQEKESENTSVINHNHPSYGGVNNEEPEGSKEPVDLLEATIGGFGRWQCQLSILVSILKIPISWVQLSITFLAPPTEFWCAPPKKFKRMPVYDWIALISNYSHSTSNKHMCMMKDVLNKKNTSFVPCLWGYEYNTTIIQSSIITEWDLVCDHKFLVALTQSVLMFGVLIGIIIFGPAADKYGRRKVLLISISLQTMFGILSTISPWFSLFLIFRFLLAVVGSGVMVTSFVMCVEIVAGKWRTTVPILHQVPFGLGNSIMAGMAYFIRDWRELQLILFGISALYTCYYWLVPESPRWLMAVGKKEETILILEKAATMNGIDKTVIRKNVNGLTFISDDSIQNNVELTSVFQTSELRRRSIFLCIKWFANGIVFYGFYQYAGQISDNMYLSVAFTGLISIPGGIIGVLMVRKCGRRISISCANYFTAICLFAIMFIPRGVYYQDWPIILLAGGGILGLTVSSPALHLFTGELYPTVLRNAAVGLNIMLTKLGAIVAPFIIELNDISPLIPMGTFGILSVMEGLITYPLPETLNAMLPERISDVEDALH